jgi:mono/diheme cytochrome c family protein
MAKVFRWLGFGVAGLLALAVAGFAYFMVAYPKVPPAADITVAKSDAKLERGRYLAEHVAVCVDCHSQRDWTRFSGPVIPSSFGQGGERFGHELGFPGDLIASNITPSALGSWSDGELLRALTSGVSADGHALFPFMNWINYGKLCRDDLEALITYVRSLTAIPNPTPPTKLDFPVNLIVRSLPFERPLVETCPDPKDTVAHGRYLVETAGCFDCHTQRLGPEPNLALSFAGGVDLPVPTGGKSMKSKNITPDASGIGGWSREAFIARFAMYRLPENVPSVSKDDLSTYMPWSMYAFMTDEDLGAIYDFLRTVKPVKSSDTEFAAR